jgi:rare lipoprotein A
LKRRAARLLLLAPLLAVGCSLFRRPASEAGPQPRYVVGSAYQAGGVWFYPREDFHLNATGLAVTLPDRSGLTADGERRDANAMAGAHATVQLPTIARVTNLETGLQVLIRINDRGPANPGRLIGLTRHAADRLGMTPGAVARVRVQVEDEPSQALRDALRGGSVAVASAPLGKVTAEPLAPPPGLTQSTRGRAIAGIMPVTASIASPVVAPAILPDTAVAVPAYPGQLWLWAGEFGQAGYANQVRSRLAVVGTTVERLRQGRSDIFRVRAGPFADVAAADSALTRAMRAGVTDARIVVE